MSACVPKTLDSTWCEILHEEFEKPYFAQIVHYYKESLKLGNVFPTRENVFAAFNLTPLRKIRVVILGQDPYHGSFLHDGKRIPQAMGLSFSVPRGAPLPPSLRNIYKELHDNLGVAIPTHGDLSAWATRGVLLLNAILSVQEGRAGSHQHFGWESFTDAAIRKVSEQCDGVVFLLWGKFAQKKIPLIDASKHHILTAPHPSPLAQGFLGSKIFARADCLLRQNAPFCWEL